MATLARLVVCMLGAICATADDVEVFIRSLDENDSLCSCPNHLEVGIMYRSVSETIVLEKTVQAFSTFKTDHRLSPQETFLRKISKCQELVEYRDSANMTKLDVECHRVDETVRYRVQGRIVLSSGVIYNLQPRQDVYSEGKYSLQDIITDTPNLDRLLINESDWVRDRDTELYERLKRHRRETGNIYIDAVALIGYSVFQGALLRSAASTDSEKREEALTGIHTNIALLFKTVDIRFRSAGSNINIRLVGCYIEDEAESQWVQRTREGQGSETRLDGNRMLGAIWNYTTTVDNFPSFDVVVAFESLSLFSFDQNGYLFDFSSQSSICSSNSQPVVLVHYRYLFTLDAAATTKGLGHALGALEDGVNNNCSSSDHFMMSASYQDLYELENNNPYYFSTCSLQYFSNYTQQLLSGGDTSARSCLENALPAYNVTNVTGILPGELYNPDAQCRLVYGAQSYYCFHTDTLSHKDLCKRLQCYYPPTDTCYFLYAAEGTSCGNKKWCDSGECVYSEDAPITDDVCIHGNQGGVDCDTVTFYYPYYCYYDNIQLVCCQSCKNITGTDEGCLYGDNNYVQSDCELTGCNVTSYRDTCCETCASFRTTTSSLSTTLTSEMTTSVTTTTTARSRSTSTTTSTSAPTASTTSATTITATTYPSSTSSLTTTTSIRPTSATPVTTSIIAATTTIASIPITTATTATVPTTTTTASTTNTPTTTLPSSTTRSKTLTSMASLTPTTTATTTIVSSATPTTSLTTRLSSTTTTTTGGSPSTSVSYSSRIVSTSSSSSTSSQSQKPTSTSGSSKVFTGSHVTKEMSSTKTEVGVTSEKHQTTEKSTSEQNPSPFTDSMKVGVGVGVGVSVLVTVCVTSVVIHKMKARGTADITEWNSLREI